MICGIRSANRLSNLHSRANWNIFTERWWINKISTVCNNMVTISVFGSPQILITDVKWRRVATSWWLMNEDFGGRVFVCDLDFQNSVWEIGYEQWTSGSAKVHNEWNSIRKSPRMLEMSNWWYVVVDKWRR